MPRLSTGLRSGALRAVPKLRYTINTDTGSGDGFTLFSARTITVSDNSVNEDGGTVTFTVTGSRALGTEGTQLYWIIKSDRMIGADFTDGLMRGTVTVANSEAVITRTLASDLGIEDEKFSLEVREQGYWGPIVGTSPEITVVDGSVLATYTMTQDRTLMNEEETVTFTINSDDAPDGRVLYWSTLGTMPASEFSDNTISGQVTIVNGTATITRRPAFNNKIEQQRSFSIIVRRTSQSGEVVATSDPVAVNDAPSWLKLTSPSGSVSIVTGAATSMNTAGDWTAEVLDTVTVTVKCWGAAGGSLGGTGAFARGNMILTAGQIYKIRVGGGGRTAGTGGGYAGGHGGGGLCGRVNNSSVTQGSGGGLTGLFINSVSQSNARVLAAGGGGGSGGGGGGGPTGQTGDNYGNGRGGGGASQSSGGFAGYNSGAPGYNCGNTAGTALTGGKGATGTGTNYSGGGGGGGYFGGGGGSGNNYRGAPGGGGSSWLASTSIVTSNRVTAVGSKGSNTSRLAPYNTDIDYKNNAGRTTTTSIGVAQPAGLCVIRRA